jgi:hypothetical protein
MAKQENGQPNMRILSDNEFLVMVADRGNPQEMNQAILTLRREGRIQLFDDGSGDPLLIQLEKTN